MLSFEVNESIKCGKDFKDVSLLHVCIPYDTDTDTDTDTDINIQCVVFAHKFPS